MMMFQFSYVTNHEGQLCQKVSTSRYLSTKYQSRYDDDDDNEFNNVLTHEGYLHQNGW